MLLLFIIVMIIMNIITIMIELVFFDKFGQRS